MSELEKGRDGTIYRLLAEVMVSGKVGPKSVQFVGCFVLLDSQFNALAGSWKGGNLASGGKGMSVLGLASMLEEDVELEDKCRSVWEGMNSQTSGSLNKGHSNYYREEDLHRLEEILHTMCVSLVRHIRDFGGNPNELTPLAVLGL
jgi:hypothetical protein